MYVYMCVCMYVRMNDGMYVCMYTFEIIPILVLQTPKNSESVICKYSPLEQCYSNAHCSQMF